MKTRLYRLLFLCFLAGCTLMTSCAAPPVPCNDPLGCLVIPPGGSIRIAYLLPLSGPFGHLGAEARGGIELAVEERDRDLLGYPIEIVEGEPDCNRESLLKSATQIAIQADILGVIGPFCPDSVLALSVLRDAGLAAISLPEATLPFDINGVSPGVFRLSPDEQAQGRLVAEFAYHSLGARRAAVLGDSSEYARNLERAFSQNFQMLGGDVTLKIDVSEEDAITAAFQQLSTDPPDVIFLPLSRRLGDRALRRYRDFPDLSQAALLGGDGLFDRELFRGIDSSDGLYVAGIAPDGERYARFAEAWKAKFGEPPGTSQSVLAFDATGILLNAVEKVAEPDKSGMLVIGRQALRTTIANLERYPGLSGTISCSPSGNCFVNGSLAVFTITPAQTSGERWPPEILWRSDQDGS